ncbi:hypothetical protein [Sphingomonas humi]|uniref:hypothetical protein n=1 Tax=Sphingomonas humi TaxID=335630 RepID=UPI0031E2C927
MFLALLIAAVLIARPGTKTVDEVSPPAPRPVQPEQPTTLTPLTRADLIDVAARAADAHARGVAIAPEDNALVGRPFTVTLPFGCDGPAAAASEAPLRWSYDPEAETLRVWVTSNIWTDAAPVRKAAEGIDYEAAEGFWIERPWLRSGECPVTPQLNEAGAAAPGAAEGNETAVQASLDETASPGDSETALVSARQTLALVELFEPGSRRAARRNGRPYTVVTKLAPDAIDLSKGLRVVVTGRLARLTAGGPVACDGTFINERPLCLIGVEIDRVAITDASGERILGEWGS